MSPKRQITSERKARLILGALEDKKAVDPVVIPVRDRTVMTDHLVIAGGTSRIHIRALVDGVIEKLTEKGIKGKRVEGHDEAVWVLLDYGDVVVHIMAQEQRDFYKLESYWTGAEKGSPPPLSTEQVE